MNKYSWIFLSLILALGAILRLYHLSQIPPGVNRDEASIGVTAFSLMTTGKDEYGRAFPLSFESFGDWKLPLYIYTVIPFIKIFGLSEIAVRLPSAIAGILTVLTVFFVARLLFRSVTISLLASLVLAIMPWHMHISRVESEAIVATLFSTLGVYMFSRSIQNKKLSYLILSSILFSLTYYSYHGTHVTTTLLLVGLGIIYRKNIVTIPKFWIAGVIGGIATMGILLVTMKADNTKISGISIFGDPTVVNFQIENPRNAHSDTQSIQARLFHNKATYAMVTIFQNYLKSYSTEFLFVKGGTNTAHNIQGYGNLHLIEAPLLLLGLIWLITNIRKREAQIILWWVFSSGLAAAITKDAPHSNRMLAVVPSLAITIALGIEYLFQIIPKRRHAFALLFVIGGYIASSSYYLDRYFVHFPYSEASNWGFAYRSLVPYLFSPEHRRKHIIITNPETSPYVYLWFYSRYSPMEFQQEVKRYPISRDGFTDVSEFGRFSFRPIDWKNDMNTAQILLVTKPSDVPDIYKPQIIESIALPDGTNQFVIIQSYL